MAERDTRFGGNIERANRGIPYPTGGRDVRFEGSLPHKFQYRDQGRTVVSGNEPAFTDMGRNRNVPFPQSTGTPNFRPPYGAPGQPSYNQWRQQIDPYSNQMRSRTPSDIGYDRMGGGLGGLQEKSQLRRPEDFTNLGMLGRPDLSFKYSHMGPSEGMGVGGKGETRWSDYTVGGTGGWDDDTIRGTWRRMQDARRADEMDEYGYLEGAPRQRTTFTEGYISPQAFNEMYGGVYDDAIFRTVDPNTNRIEQYPQAGESEQSKVNLQEIMNRMPWMNPWRLIQNLDARGIEYANRGGLMSLRR
jgi:hypothetical protein